MILLSACGEHSASVSPPAPTPWLLQKGETGRLPVEAGGAPTVETPYLQLNLQVTDKQTGERVNIAVLSVDGYEMGRGCCPTVMLEATTPHTLTIEAKGYVPWSVELNPHIQHNTVMTAPVQLEPIKPEAQVMAAA